jgi:hypothetical protein
MSCDDNCKFYMSTSDPTNPAAKTMLIERGYSSFRDFANWKYG